MNTETVDRVVDAADQGWHPVGGADGGATVWAADYGWQRGLDNHASLEELAAARGPLRPVLPITGADRDALHTVFAVAGRKTVYTVAVAVQLAFHEVRDLHGGLTGDVHESYEHTRRQLLAGREGSWESEALFSLLLWADRSKTKRVHPDALATITAMIVRWVTNPDRFTEVAATLAAIVAGYADTHGGWNAIADQWLQPGGLDTEGVHVTQHLLYSSSEHFNPEVLQ